MFRRATRMASAMGGFRRSTGRRRRTKCGTRSGRANGISGWRRKRAESAPGNGAWEPAACCGRHRCSAISVCAPIRPAPVEADGVASVSDERLVAAGDIPRTARASLPCSPNIPARAGPMRIEYRIVRPDGAVHWIVLLGDGDGRRDGQSGDDARDLDRQHAPPRDRRDGRGGAARPRAPAARAERGAGAARRSAHPPARRQPRPDPGDLRQFSGLAEPVPRHR